MVLVRTLCLLVCGGLCVAGLSSCGKTDSRSGREVLSVTGSPRIDLDRAYSIGDYKTAIPLLQEQLEAEPEDGRNWFRLGYALHSENRLEEAIVAHEKASTLDESQKATAIYNWACALAMLGKTDEAIQRLQLAVDAGFDRRQTIADDTDLESISQEPEFLAILESLVPPGDSGGVKSPHTDFSFWVGDWDLETKVGQRVGRTSVVLQHNGFALTETWRLEGGRRGTTLTFYDPREDVWKQTLVSNKGRINYLTGRFEDGTMLLSGDFVTRDGQHGLRKIWMTPKGADQTVEYRVSESRDDGASWDVVFEGRWLPRKPRLAL